MSYCTRCGVEQTPEDRFCTSCGSLAAASTAQHPTWGPATVVPDGSPAWGEPHGETRDYRNPDAGGLPPGPRLWGPAAPAPPAWGGRQLAPDRSRVRLVAAITGVALVVLGGSAAAWATIAHQEQTTAAGPTTAPQPAPRPGQPPVVTPTRTSAPPTTAPFGGDGVVTLSSGAAAQPSASQVQSLLQRHFSAINSLDYDAWAATVTPARARDQSREGWVEGYRTTYDSDISVTAIQPGGAGTALVSASFVSTQAPEDAPADLRVGRICWTQQIPVTGLGSDPRLGAAAKGSSTKTAC